MKRRQRRHVKAFAHSVHGFTRLCKRVILGHNIMLGRNRSAWWDFTRSAAASQAPVSAAAYHAVLDRMIQEINRHGLREAAAVILDAGRPLAFVAAQLLWTALPLYSMFTPATKLGMLAEILEDPEMLAELSARLEGSEG